MKIKSVIISALRIKCSVGSLKCLMFCVISYSKQIISKRVRSALSFWRRHITSLQDLHKRYNVKRVLYFLRRCCKMGSSCCSVMKIIKSWFLKEIRIILSYTCKRVRGKSRFNKMMKSRKLRKLKEKRWLLNTKNKRKRTMKSLLRNRLITSKKKQSKSLSSISISFKRSVHLMIRWHRVII